MRLSSLLFNATMVCIGASILVATVLLWVAPSSCTSAWDALVDPLSCEKAP